MSAQETLVILKPDAFRKGVWSELLKGYRSKKLKIAGARFMHADRTLLEKHYVEHQNKPFFHDLVEYISGGLILVLRVRGSHAITKVRNFNLIIRKFHATPNNFFENVVHGSDSPESAVRELKLFFGNGGNGNGNGKGKGHGQ